MTEEELRKDYYADRPSEPYSDDDRPSDWANIAHYAEENLENAFKRIEELGKENAELKEQIADLKNYCCEVSKYLHDNSVARPDASAYKKRDALLIKEFKLCEKWGDLK